MSAPGTFSSTDAASRAVRKSPGTNSPSPSMKKQRSASPSHAMPRSAPVSQHLLDDELAVLGQQRVRLVVGELAVRDPVGLDDLDRELVQDRADHRARHAVAAVHDDLQRLDHGRVDDLQRDLVEVGVDLDLLEAAAARGFAEPVLDVRADLGQAAVAGQRDRAALDHLRARVGLRVVAGGAHQAAVEVAAADQPIQHLGADHAGVHDVRALGHQTLAVAQGELGSGQAHVAAQAHPELAHRLAGEVREGAGEAAADGLRRVAVDVLPVEAADVVGLEDAREVSRHAAGA